MDKKALQEKIIQTIEKTESEIADLTELTRPIGPENAIGRVSRMDAINNKSVNELALRKAKLKLDKLKVAAAKIQEKDFGFCTSCGNEIQEGRLMLMPESSLCIRCASRY